MDAGLDPAGFADGGGQRSDTMLLLRFVDGKAKMMSIPRDLYVPIAETGGSQKINAAYNGGPRRLIQTVQQSLGIPINHYLEVDFVSFAKLVDCAGWHHDRLPPPGVRPQLRPRRARGRPGGARRRPGARPSCAPATTWRSSTARRCPTPPATSAGSCASSSSSRPSSASSAASRTRSPSPGRRAAPPAGSASTTPSSLWEAIQFAWRLRSLDPDARRAPHPPRQQRGRLGAVPRARRRRRPRPVPLAPASGRVHAQLGGLHARPHRDARGRGPARPGRRR